MESDESTFKTTGSIPSHPTSASNTLSSDEQSLSDDFSSDETNGRNASTEGLNQFEHKMQEFRHLFASMENKSLDLQAMLKRAQTSNQQLSTELNNSKQEFIKAKKMLEDEKQLVETNKSKHWCGICSSEATVLMGSMYVCDLPCLRIAW